MQFLDDFEDLDILTKGEFSTVAQVSGASAPNVTELSGIFDQNYQEAFSFGDPQIAEGRKFCFQVQTAEIPGIVQGDRLTIHGKNYLITSIQPKHDGKLTYLILKEDFS